jgi:predicted O-methyltransferase YrrM
MLVVGRQARRVVEFGSSLGISTIFLAAAVHDTDSAGSVITTELRPDKAKTALSHLADAGLGHLVDLRLGDALQTLADIEEPIDLLFLDGRSDLYLVLLRLLEPRLAAAALIIADLNSGDPDLLPYLEYVRGAESSYQSIEIPLGDGVELSVLGSD